MTGCSVEDAPSSADWAAGHAAARVRLQIGGTAVGRAEQALAVCGTADAPACRSRLAQGVVGYMRSELHFRAFCLPLAELVEAGATGLLHDVFPSVGALIQPGPRERGFDAQTSGTLRLLNRYYLIGRRSAPRTFGPLPECRPRNAVPRPPGDDWATSRRPAAAPCEHACRPGIRPVWRPNPRRPGSCGRARPAANRSTAGRGA